jgi:hypothetical protein
MYERQDIRVCISYDCSSGSICSLWTPNEKEFNRSMFDKNIFEKAKDMIGNVTKFKKQSK